MVSQASLMQEMKAGHSLQGLCEPRDTQAETTAGRLSSPAGAETDSGQRENLGPEASRNQARGLV